MSNSNKRGAGPDASVPDTFKPGNRKTSAEATEKRYDPAKQAAGGKNKDVGEQNADTAQPGRAGHRDDQNGPGGPVAEGGKNRMSGFNGAMPATAGRTAPAHSVDAAGREFKGPAAAFGHTEVAENAPHSSGSATKYAKGDKAFDSDRTMPDWHRTRSRGASPRGG